MRAVALDVHRDFCEVAIVAEGRLRSAGRIEARPEALELFALPTGDASHVIATPTSGRTLTQKTSPPPCRPEIRPRTSAPLPLRCRTP